MKGQWVKSMFSAKAESRMGMDKKTLTQQINLPNATITLESDAYQDDDYEPSDTKVIVDDTVLFVISGDQINEFKDDLNALVDKYSI